MTLTANQMRKQIAEMEAEDVLSPQAQRRLRDMKIALPEIEQREEKRKAMRAKFRAESGATETPRRPKQDDGLSGRAWVNWYNTYCNPTGRYPATLDMFPETGRAARTRTERTEQDAPKPKSKAKRTTQERTAIETKNGETRILGWRVETAERFLTLDKEGKLETTLPARQYARVSRKLDAIRSAFASLHQAAATA